MTYIYVHEDVMKRTIAITAAVLMLAACGKEDNNANSNTNNGTNNDNNMSNATNNDNNMSNATNNDNNVSNTMNNMSNNATNNETIVPCGDVTFEGECSDATTVLYCDDDFGLVEIPCADNNGANSTCIDVDEYGADCAVPAGEACELYDEDLDEYFYLFCSGNEPACLWSAADTVTCSDDFGICDSDTFAESCAGDTYIYDCNFGQPLAADCAGLGGTCDDTQGCVMPMDATCDDLILLCDAGLTCTIPDDEALGTCTTM